MSPLVFAAIVIVLIIIGTTLYFVLTKDEASPLDTLGREAEVSEVRPISVDDWVLGNPNAPVVFVVYSDFECPFCKNYHQTMHSIMREYGKDGRVAWVYRHIPLVQLHSQAPTEALASECVGEDGGNDAFWKFADTLFEETPSNNNLDLTRLPQFAERAGVSRAEFEACMRSDRLMRRVEEDFAEAIAAGAVGSPFTVAFAAGQQIRIEGGHLYPAMKTVTETLLAQVGHSDGGLQAPTVDSSSMIDRVFDESFVDTQQYEDLEYDPVFDEEAPEAANDTSPSLVEPDAQEELSGEGTDPFVDASSE
jgi:predicted DsbA family dithiol-disulfide isomerase